MSKPLKDPSDQHESMYNTAVIRELLNRAFTDRQLRRFCYDRPQFRPVTKVVGPEDGLADVVDALIEHCGVYLLFDELLQEVQEENPRQFKRFESQLRSCSRSQRVSASRGSWPRARLFMLGALPLVLAIALGMWWLVDNKTSSQDSLAKGNSFLALGEYEEAIIEYNKELERDPQNVAAIVNSAVAYFYLDRFPQAIGRYQEAIALGARDADIYSNLGAAHFRLNEWVIAKAYYEQAIEINPELPQAWYGKAAVAKETGDIVEAVGAFWQFMKIEAQLDRSQRDGEAENIANEYLERWSVTHVVRYGETISRIAIQYDVTEEAIIVANQLADPGDFQLAVELVIPLVEIVVPEDTPLPYEPPPAAAAIALQITISEILGVGEADLERVVITNTGEQLVYMEGWTLSDTSGNVYTFPAFRLWHGGSVILHTRIGEDGSPPANFYWGKLDPIWSPGDLATLRDFQGSVVAAAAVAP